MYGSRDKGKLGAVARGRRVDVAAFLSLYPRVPSLVIFSL